MESFTRVLIYKLTFIYIYIYIGLLGIHGRGKLNWWLYVYILKKNTHTQMDQISLSIHVSSIIQLTHHASVHMLTSTASTRRRWKQGGENPRKKMETGEDQGSKTLRHWHVQLWLDHEGWSQNLGLCFVGPAVNPLVNCR